MLMASTTKLFFGICAPACCLFAIAPVASSSRTSKEPIYDDAEGYAVLSVLLDRYNPGSKDLVVQIFPRTASENQMFSSLECKEVPDEFLTAAKDFHDKNKIKFRLEPRFSLKFKYELTENPRKSLPPQAPGEQEVELPVFGPLYQVSAVGFDAAKTHAIAYVDAVCGSECGGGAYHFLRKEAKGWKEVPGSPVCEWVSQNQSFLAPHG